jgi:hypothetical protein
MEEVGLSVITGFFITLSTVSSLLILRFAEGRIKTLIDREKSLNRQREKPLKL